MLNVIDGDSDLIAMSNLRLTATAGLLGALAMFAGDMLFYGQWGSGADAAASTLAILRTAPPSHLTLGGLLSILGGLGYLASAVHIHARLAPAPPPFRYATSGALIAVFVTAVATHAVWGAFALAVRSGAPAAQDLIYRYLSLNFLVGTVIAVPTALALAGLTLTNKTAWPRWMALANPGLWYAILSTGVWIPAPLGAALFGGAFNLSFALFFAACLFAPQRR